MLLIDTYIKNINDTISLYSKKELTNGTIIWMIDTKFDKIFSDDYVNKLNSISKNFIELYGYKQLDNNWYITLDNFKFINHSIDPNIGLFLNYNNTIEYAVTIKNIKKDDELSINFKYLKNNIN
jgi:hypothetical protein